MKSSITGCNVCHGPVDSSLRTGKPKKYCSKACSNEFYKQRNKKALEQERVGDPYWIEKRKKTQERKDLEKARQVEFEWYTNNWKGIPFFEERGLSKGTVHARSNNLQLKNHIVSGGAKKTFGCGRKAFWCPEDAEKILNWVYSKPAYDDPPQGYIIKEDVESMLCARGVGKKHLRQIGCSMLQQANNNRPSKRGLWLVSDVTSYLDEFIAQKQAREKGWEQKRIAKERKKQEARERIKSNREKREREKKEKEEVSLKLREERAQKKKQRMCLPDHVLKHELTAIADLYMSNETSGSRALKKNENYEKKAQSGITQKFTCKTCFKEKPYVEFYRDLTYNCGRRTSKCKTCTSTSRRRDPVEDALKWKKDYVYKMRMLVAGAIKKYIARATGYASQLRVPVIWKYIEDNLGYTAQDFCDHLESQFDENMNWGNHGRLCKNRTYRWQIDHIVPQSSYEYSSLEDPKLLECWALSNIQPLSAAENNAKGHRERWDPPNKNK